MHKFFFGLWFAISVTTAVAQTSSIQSTLDKLEEIVPLEYSETVNQIIAQKIETDKYNTIQTLKTFFQREEELIAVFDEYNLPKELRFSCISLSNCQQSSKEDPTKAGWFQVSYQTAKKNGLFISNYVDERLDIIQSARVFCEEISKIYTIHNDWRKALTIYACGDALWQKARILSKDSLDDFNLINLKLEHPYFKIYPNFVAAVYVAELYKYVKNELPAIDSTTDVPIDHYVTFKRISEQLTIDIDRLKKLNPIYKNEIIPTMNRLHFLKIPISKDSLFYERRDSFYTEQNADTVKQTNVINQSRSTNDLVTIIYTVRSGDVLSRIADLYDCSISEIRNWNHIRGDIIQINQRIVIKKPLSKKSYYQSINRMSQAQKNNVIQKD